MQKIVLPIFLTFQLTIHHRNLKALQARRSYMLYFIFGLGLVVIILKLLLLILSGAWNLAIIIPIITVIGCWALIKNNKNE